MDGRFYFWSFFRGFVVLSPMDDTSDYNTQASPFVKNQTRWCHGKSIWKGMAVLFEGNVVYLFRQKRLLCARRYLRNIWNVGVGFLYFHGNTPFKPCNITQIFALMIYKKNIILFARSSKSLLNVRYWVSLYFSPREINYYRVPN